MLNNRFENLIKNKKMYGSESKDYLDSFNIINLNDEMQYTKDRYK
ncbi:MAG: hypothetical protein RR290_02805 [Clostridia bacterium]